ncbi:TetR/AcrR family transcriptional regulator [Actinoplanes sp. NPDC051411]|uniref:TetR/AcrR family transcriptional regulator n=1 Tax=Actinoplanes sp. NPDC051411 TaxID=3155522 RepID=UPI003427B11E
MPKVSDEYRDARREQILAAARRVFRRNGFHATSMQDLFAEAQLSSGAVYRYFRSKDEMVLAIAEDGIRGVIALMASVARDRDGRSIGEALAAATELVREKDEQDGLAGLGIQVWGEALRNPDLRESFATMLRGIKTEIAEVVRQDQAAGRLPAGVPPEDLAGVLVAVLPGVILQLAMFGPKESAGLPDALRALWPA